MPKRKTRPRASDETIGGKSEIGDSAKTGWALGPQVKPPPMAHESKESDSTKRPFTPEVLDRTIIAIPLLEDFRKELEELREHPTRAPKIYPVIIDINLEYHFGRNG